MTKLSSFPFAVAGLAISTMNTGAAALRMQPTTAAQVPVQPDVTPTPPTATAPQEVATTTAPSAAESASEASHGKQPQAYVSTDEPWCWSSYGDAKHAFCEMLGEEHLVSGSKGWTGDYADALLFVYTAFLILLMVAAVWIAVHLCRQSGCCGAVDEEHDARRAKKSAAEFLAEDTDWDESESEEASSYVSSVLSPAAPNPFSEGTGAGGRARDPNPFSGSFSGGARNANPFSGTE